MYLLIDTLSQETCIGLFTEQREMVDLVFEDYHHQEFAKLPEAIDALLKKHDISYHSLDGIIVLIGPWWFTGTRVTCLVANSIAFWVRDAWSSVPLFGLNYFDFLDLQSIPHPQIIQANKREVMIKESQVSTPALQSKENLTEKEYWWTISTATFSDIDATFHTKMDYTVFIRELSLKDPADRVSPIYIKDPNIIIRPR